MEPQSPYASWPLSLQSKVQIHHALLGARVQILFQLRLQRRRLFGRLALAGVRHDDVGLAEAGLRLQLALVAVGPAVAAADGLPQKRAERLAI